MRLIRLFAGLMMAFAGGSLLFGRDWTLGVLALVASIEILWSLHRESHLQRV